MDAKQFIAAAVKILVEIDSLKEQLKEIKDEGKSSELDVATLTTVSVAIASNKVDSLKEKSEKTIDAIELARS